MSTTKRTSRGDSAPRAVSWSTKAVILIAFAIQLMPVSERLAHAGSRPADRLVLCDGRLVALWLADARAGDAAPVPAPRGASAPDPAEKRSGATPAAAGHRPRVALGDRALLPIPPPPGA